MFTRKNRRNRAKSAAQPPVCQARACIAEPLERRTLLSNSGQIFVAFQGSGTISEYNFNGTPLNAALVSGLAGPLGIAVSGQDLFVGNSATTGSVGEYSTSGTVVGDPLLTGFNQPYGIAVSGSNVFVASTGSGVVGEYTTIGGTVNASLVSGLTNPSGGIGVFGSDLFVLNGNTVGEYTTSGATVDAALVTGLNDPIGLAVFGSELFVLSGGGTVGEYSAAGLAVNASLVTGLNDPKSIAVAGSDLFVVYDAGTIGEFTTSGAIVNAALVSGLSGGPFGIAVTNTVPEVTINPLSQSVTAGDTVTFTAAAVGDPVPAVQWEFSSNGGNTFTYISGATDTTYSFTAAADQNGDVYQAVFSNSQGSAVTTSASLTVTSAPVVTTNPISQSVYVGATATLTAAASGYPASTVQWEISTDGGASFADLIGATNTTYTFTAALAQNGDEYEAVFTNTLASARSDPATLSVTTPPPTKVSGTVYLDRNGLGVQTRKDPSLANITLTLQQLKRGRPTGRAQSQTTNADGFYAFTNLIAGATYRLSEIAPRGYSITQPSTGLYTINLSIGQRLPGENFGNHKGKATRRAVS